jgi:hypothetical protein
MNTALAVLPDSTEGLPSGRRVRRTGLLAVLTLVLATAVSLLTVPAAAPATASGSCSAAQRGALWDGDLSVRLQRKTNCTYYAKLVIDDDDHGAGQKVHVRVQRQQKSPYGWFVTETESKSTYWGAGSWNTATVEGWPASSSEEDNHRACWKISSWHCTPWTEI